MRLLGFSKCLNITCQVLIYTFTQKTQSQIYCSLDRVPYRSERSKALFMFRLIHRSCLVSKQIIFEFSNEQNTTSRIIKSIICCFYHYHPVSYCIVTIHETFECLYKCYITYLLEPEKGRNTETLNAPTLKMEAALFILITKQAVKWLVICFPFFKNKLKAGKVCFLFITRDDCSHSKNHDATIQSTASLGTR